MKQETIKNIKKGVSVALAIGLYWIFVTTVYLVISFISKAWNITWIAFPFAILIFVLVILIYLNKKMKKSSIVNWVICTILFCAATYLLVSFLTKLWSITWIIFLVMIMAILFEIMVFLQKKTKNENQKLESTKE